MAELITSLGIENKNVSILIITTIQPKNLLRSRTKAIVLYKFKKKIQPLKFKLYLIATVNKLWYRISFLKATLSVK